MATGNHKKVGQYSTTSRNPSAPTSKMRNQYIGRTEITAPGYKRSASGKNRVRGYSGDITRRHGIVRHSSKEKY